jgi:photosystem II stability/assembly factor-like uncharacterized protein
MNRGHNRESKGLTPAWLVVYTWVCLVALSGVAAAAPGGQPPAVQSERTWENYFGVAILPSKRVVVVGDKGVVMISDDQGRTWTRQQLKNGVEYSNLYSVAFTADGSSGWAVGDNGVIFRTDDHGSTWSQQKPPAGVTGALMTVGMADAQKACAGGDHGVIVCTSDGGAHWNQQNIGDMGVFDLAFTDANNGWAVGEFHVMLHTGDGGRSWKIVSGGDRMKNSDPYFAIAFAGAHDGLALGLAGIALESSDGGNTWKSADLSIEHKSFYAVVAAPTPAGAFYAVGETGVAASIADGKLSQMQSGTSNAIVAVAFSEQFGIAVGLSGNLLRSDDGGQHWHSLNLGEQTAREGREQ